MTDKDHSLTTSDLMLVMGVALGAGAMVAAGMARKTASGTAKSGGSPHPPVSSNPAIPAKSGTVPHDDAPNHAAKAAPPGGYHVVNPGVTIAASAQDILSLWQDPTLLPAILGDEIGYAVDGDGTTAWRFGTGLKAFGPIDTRVVHERDGALLVWRSLDDEGADLEVKLRLNPAPGQRGTRVDLLVASKRAGLARLLPDVTDPAARKALKRLKMLAETGEIATSDNRRPA